MRTTAVFRLVVIWLLLAASSAACSGPLAQAPPSVRSALDPFAKAGYACAGPSSDNSAFGQWQCDLTSSDGVSYYVVLDADDSRVKQVAATVDQSHASTTRPEVAAGFFGQVTDINVGGSSPTIKGWVNSHIADGGQEHIGPVVVTLDSLRPVAHLILFASD
jgi:hypothetical protein